MDVQTSPTRTTYELTVEGVGRVPLTVDEQGEGRPFLVLHGGAGPQSVAAFSHLLAERLGVRVLTPVHPGFAGTPRPDALHDARGLAAAYAALVEHLDLHDLSVVGNSVGGWVAAELAALVGGSAGAHRWRDLTLVGAVGLEIADHRPADFFALTLDEVAELSYHDPDRFRLDLATLPPAVREAMPGNRAALAVYGGASMTDPTLVGRLGRITVPTLVVAGEADRIVDAEVARAYAALIPGARFVLLPETGHLPQIESPEALLSLLEA
ncbi:alpha/beta fold hydrolase [Microlunatus flavus]|uniref:Pimeloyl-ACP methyl ester carboxylesterase n=1 Tax=Microlunatus flavus TaxID=1036181 RepID=A0A1H9MKB4_9ACTN|nr:alpha/beta fold hydrolase [Microlunatus flavus]SER24154.1 Pimeloyl-ACP methyl ester carboxylesterase [Microlunatus flavus]